MAKFCQNCGTKLNEDQDVCLNCGKYVKTKRQQTLIQTLNPN